jgi:RNA polymerase sigma-70 factor (ECF subfamily)
LSAQLAPESNERFVSLADRQLRSAYRLAGYLLGDASEAEDAVGDAIERAWRAWPKLRDETLFEAWFNRILVNVCRDRASRRGRVQSIELTDDLHVIHHDPFRRLLDRDAIGRALGALSMDQRVVVVLRYWRDMPLEEIANRLDVPLGTVKSRLHYGLEAMRGAMTCAAAAEASG